MDIEIIIPGIKNRQAELWVPTNLIASESRIEFWKMMESIHGVKISSTCEGFVTEYEVVDEQKYVLFLLKYNHENI